MRGLNFTFWGALLGAFVAAILGKNFGEGEPFEMGIYAAGGFLLGGVLGLLTHVITKGSGRLDSILPQRTEPQNMGSAGALLVGVGLVTVAYGFLEVMNAPPTRQFAAMGCLVGGVVETGVGIAMMMMRKSGRGN